MSRETTALGKWHTIYTRLRRWAEAGVMDRVFEALQQHRLIRIKVECLGLDSTSIKVHPDGTGAPKSVTSRHPSDMPVDPAELPVWNAKHWFYEDWPTNQKIRSLRRAIAEGDRHLFNALALDIHPYVKDQIFAGHEGIFGPRLIAGVFVFIRRAGLIATHCVNAFSYGYDTLRFIKPVLIGDNLLFDPHPI